MSNRTLHVTIEDRYILLMIDMIKKADEDYEDYLPPLNNSILLFTQSVIDRMVKGGQLTDIAPAEATKIINELLHQEDEVKQLEAQDGIDNFIEAFFADPDIEPDKDVIDSIVGKVGAIQPHYEDCPKNGHSFAPVEVKSSTPPWEAADIRRFDDLKILSPKDLLIEIAVESDNKVSQRAIECIYSNIPIEMWGSDKAIKLVNNIIPTIKEYI